MALLTRVGWLDGQIVLAEDLIQLETNIENAVRTHVHGSGGVDAVVPVLPENIPLVSALGGCLTLRDHVRNGQIHYSPNQNIPGWLWGTVEVPSLTGDQPEWFSDPVQLNPAFRTTAYKVFTDINYASGTVITLPDSCVVAPEILDAGSFRLHVRFVFNPFEAHQALQVVWFAIGNDAPNLALV